ncbi:glycosyltransferase family 4 protein [Variovorax ginsengisoli]|uniref:Glycosyltransferase involved in cell wall biosynthesis n=1 Tax=Variovorax ginsengisoli TaxID=363844 RepID=A0ABT9SDF2_9BURK|nr:glycosyltransferase [Variovorax ginsengisoli]MDP9902210.1 glycosyltransferase involved in cell wall biosynthesis [Variovorax ginsengisoli]
MRFGKALKKSKLYIVHQNGAPAHYLAAAYLFEQLASDVVYIEFSILRKLGKALLVERNLKSLRRALRNAMLLGLWFLFPGLLKRHKVILGVAPLDWRVFFLSRIFKKTDLIYHTSWNIWDGTRFPFGMNRFSPVLKKIWLFFLRYRVHKIAVVTPLCAESIAQFIKPSKKEIATVFHSYDDFFSYDENFKEKSLTNLRVIYAGRLIESKGIDKIIDLARVFPDIDFCFIGKGELVAKVESCSLPNVKYKGFISNVKLMANLFRQSDVILLPSMRRKNWEELFGISLIEAMACGCIPVVTDHVGPKLILENSELSDLVFSEEDFFVNASNCLRRWQLYPDELRLRKLASSEVARKYSKSNISKIWKNLLFN